jgi:hypothetical protein
LILTDAQVQALEKKKLDDEACGEIETAHPGCLGSQDTFYVGTLKGVGHIYQQISLAALDQGDTGIKSVFPDDTRYPRQQHIHCTRAISPSAFW